MRYSGIQPQYFPRLHYFARILNADIFMLRDDAQFVGRHKYPSGKNGPSYQAHTPIKQPTGEYLLTVPFKHAGLLPIKQTEISYNDRWTHAHLGTLLTFYGKAPHIKVLMPEIEDLLKTRYQYVGELDLATLLWGLLHLLGEERVTKEMLSLSYVREKLKKQATFRLKDIQLGSETKALTDPSLDRNEKIVAVIKEVGADEDYCGGTAQQAYMDMELFKKNGIKITVQDWKCKEYPQQFIKQQGFLPNLSIIDLLMNAAHTEAVRIIKG